MGGAGPSTTDFLAIFILAGVVSIIFGRVCPLACIAPRAGREGQDSTGFISIVLCLFTKSKSHKFGS